MERRESKIKGMGLSERDQTVYGRGPIVGYFIRLVQVQHS